jgi:hypothetical protein
MLKYVARTHARHTHTHTQDYCSTEDYIGQYKESHRIAQSAKTEQSLGMEYVCVFAHILLRNNIFQKSANIQQFYDSQ